MYIQGTYIHNEMTAVYAVFKYKASHVFLFLECFHMFSYFLIVHKSIAMIKLLHSLLK